MNAKTTRVTLYTASGCSHCQRARQYLRQCHIRFGEQDISRSARALKAFQRWGGRTVPLLLIGETPIAGFDQRRIVKTLRDAGFDV
ncbi:MAG: glutaredoxin family protein [Gammaproteobacteria bacterium]|nr:glutaredoxin family protein [Gammaproteobacteria bacterium]